MALEKLRSVCCTENKDNEVLRRNITVNSGNRKTRIRAPIVIVYMRDTQEKMEASKRKKCQTFLPIELHIAKRKDFDTATSVEGGFSQDANNTLWLAVFSCGSYRYTI